MVFPNGTETILKNPAEFPEIGAIPGMKFQEPMVNALLTFPQEYIGPLLTVCEVSHAPGTANESTWIDAFVRHPHDVNQNGVTRSGAASSWR